MHRLRNTGGRRAARTVLGSDRPPLARRELWRGTPGATTLELDVQHDAQRNRRPLLGQELLVLQLHARGYGPPQCCELAGHAKGACADMLATAAAALGVAGATDAVPEALRRGLVD